MANITLFFSKKSTQLMSKRSLTQCLICLLDKNMHCSRAYVHKTKIDYLWDVKQQWNRLYVPNFSVVLIMNIFYVQHLALYWS